MKKVLLISAFILFSVNSFSTHLVGGNLAYTYLGDTDGDGDFNYLITFQTFLDCNSPFWLTGFPEPTLDVGIYQGVGIPTGNLPLIMIATLPLIDSNSIVPVPTNGCLIGQAVCLYQATYQVEVDLPNSFQGYHLFYDRCCRTGSVVNLFNPGDQGLSFHAYIAPTIVQNSSPVFSDVPVPFLCVNDTASILNSAIDPDGDLLLFSFVDPYRGFGNSGNPAPPLPNPTLSWPIPTVNWLNVTYNQNNPFGPAGYAFINGATGLTQYMAPTTGDYVVAVEIREFRNGNLIGITRRDIQIVVINCPPNPPPNLSPTGGSGITQYTLQECDTLSFPIIFEDPNGDSLTLTTSGQIFDTSFVNPAATIDSLIIGDSTVTANFNWQTSCGTAQALPYLFTVSTTDNGCPSKTTNIVYQVTVEPPAPPDSIIGPPLVCQNSNAIYSVDSISGYTYTWTLTNGTIISGQGSASINVNWPNIGAGTVSVIAISDCGCPSAAIDTGITILAAPIADAGVGTIICFGDSATIGGSPTGSLGTTFLWTPNININNTTIPNPIVWPTITTSYIVAVDNGTCITNDTILISVGSTNINAGPDTSICLGDSTQLNALGGITYFWSPSVGLSDTTIANPMATPIITTSYIVTVTDSLGCIGLDTVIIFVDTIPVAIMSGDTSICLGDCVQISAIGGASYLWSPSGTLSDSTISNPIACPIITTTYYVDVINSTSCFTQDSLIVTVTPLPTITTNNDTSVCDGLCVQLNTSGGISYLWTPSTSLSDDTIANPIACPLVTTTYIVTGIDTNGCSNNDTVVITINPLPIIDAGPDLWLCSGDSIQLNATGGTNYLWTPSMGLNDTTIANPMANPLTNSSYIVTGFDINSCSSNDTILITVNDDVPIDPGVGATICPGDSVLLGGSPTSPSGTTYLWFPNGGTLDDDTLANPTAFPTVTTTYYVVATNDTCTAIDSVTIIVNLFPLINAGSDIDICIGDSVQLNVGGGISYIWQPGGLLNDSTIANPTGFTTTNTEFIVFGTDANGCSAYDSVLVNVNSLPTISAGAATSICSGDSVQLTASGGSSYLWSPGNSLTDSTVFNPLAFPPGTTTYIVVGTDANGCSNLDSIIVNVTQLNITDLTDTIICIGEALQLTVNGPLGATYLWSPSTDLSNTTIFNPITTTQVTITYSVTVTDVNGCVDTTSILVTAELAPVASFTLETTPSCQGISANFTNLSVGASSYLWNFGDGNQSTEINPTHTFEYGSSAIIILTAYSLGLCSDTSSYLISTDNFEDYFNLTPPTILTPNRDGLNDLFKIDLPDGIGNCTDIKVFNRWGMKIYDSYGQNGGWDGRTTAGTKVPDGTYFYIIEINGIIKKGSLTLIE